MRPFEELDPKIRKTAEKADRLRKQNSFRIGRLEQMGVGLDVTHARIDHLMDQLVDLGVITEEQNYAILVSWETNLSEQIDSAEEMVKKHIQQSRQSAISVVQKSGLVDPTGRPIQAPPPPPQARVELPKPPEPEATDD